MNKRSAIVLTVLTISGSTACAEEPEKTSNPPPPPPETIETMNPPRQPPPELVKRPPPAEPIERVELGQAEAGEYSKVLNERHPEHGRIFATADGGCVVYPSDGQTRPPGMRPPALEVACPPFMLKPEWGHCTGDARLMAKDMSDDCACMPNGNPPPPGFQVPCPSE